MADIRINALATTAASTASDDYIAIDGSANGTRKLDAYSPTFGGNLTVSGGTIGTAASTNLTLNGGSSGASLVLGQGTTGDATFSNSANTGFIIGANNATSGTGAFSALGLLAGTRQSFIYRFSEGYSSSGYYVAGALVFENNGTAGHMIFADAGSESMRITATTRNLLIGTTTDGGQKLQVAGTAYIGSATATVNPLTVQGNGPNTTHQAGTATSALWNRWLNSAGTRRGYYGYASSGDSTFTIMNEENGSFVIGTNSATALTLDSSQQAKFSSAVYCNTTTQSSGVVGAKLITKQTSGTGDWTATLDGNPDGVAGASFGLRILAGTNSSDYSLYIRNQTNTTTLLAVKGSGRVNMGALPTSSAGLSAGDIWNDAGTLKIV